MGIEPLFLVAVVAVMFLVQAARALHERVGDRLLDARWTSEAVAELTGETPVDLRFAPWPGTEAKHVVHDATGVWQRGIHRYLGWLEPSVVVVVRLERPTVTGFVASQRPSVVRRPIALHNPVLDQLLRVRADDEEAARALVSDPRVHEPLVELLGRHPLSVVTGDVVALWCARPVGDPQALVDLALELAEAMSSVSRAHADRGAEVRGLVGRGPGSHPAGR